MKLGFRNIAKVKNTGVEELLQMKEETLVMMKNIT